MASRWASGTPTQDRSITAIRPSSTRCRPSTTRGGINNLTLSMMHLPKITATWYAYLLDRAQGPEGQVLKINLKPFFRGKFTQNREEWPALLLWVPGSLAILLLSPYYWIIPLLSKISTISISSKVRLCPQCSWEVPDFLRCPWLQKKMRPWY
jgi:hypothetical protein